MNSEKVWFVTGASKGLGLSLVKQAIEAGHNVAATSRNADALAAAVGGADPDRFLPLSVRLDEEQSVAAAIAAAIEKFGRIDVVVNNAGYGIGGAIGELGDPAVRRSFDINVFGTLHVIRQALPQLRKQKNGHIINISSIAGLTSSAGWGIYAATKFVVTGLSEVLADELEPAGIKVTVVAPGAFRTSFLSEESLDIPGAPTEDYPVVRANLERYAEMNGKQAGDPEKATRVLMQIVAMENPPRYLLLGSDAYSRALSKLENLRSEFLKWEELTKSTDF